jgi:hypothetical protein
MLQKALSLLEGTLVGSEAGVGMLKIVKAVCAEPARHHELGVTNERETSAPAIKRRRGLTEREQKVLSSRKERGTGRLLKFLGLVIGPSKSIGRPRSGR